MTIFIALLRGINVVGANKVPMVELRKQCEKAGFADVQTYIASGNLVLTGGGSAAAVAAKVEALLVKKFKVEVPVIVRSAEQWKPYLRSPFPEVLPKILHLCLSKAPPKKEAVAALQERAAAGERIKLVGDALWIDFADSGVAGSKLTPAFLNKVVGSPVTARNWNTVQKLGEMAGV